MKQINLGGAASSPELVARLERAFPGCDVMAGYGLTETSPVATCARDKSTVRYTDDQDRQRHRASTGWPIPGCEIRVVNPRMQDVPRDMQSIGEIVIRGNVLMKGYYLDPEGTEHAFRGGWFHTGDLGKSDRDGFLYITGRIKNIIVLGSGKTLDHMELLKEVTIG